MVKLIIVDVWENFIFFKEVFYVFVNLLLCYRYKLFNNFYRVLKVGYVIFLVF